MVSSVPGLAADLVVFDLERVRDVATFEKPLQYSEGFSHVVVNGRVVIDDGKMTTERPGTAPDTGAALSQRGAGGIRATEHIP